MAWTQQGNIRGPKGDPGNSVQLRIDGGYIQWRPDGGGGSWTNLVSLADLTGPAGEGIEISGSVATYANLPGNLGAGDAGQGYLVEADGLLYIWDGSNFPADGSGVAFQGPPGTPGANGKEVELRVDSGQIQWRLDGGSWSNLIAISALKGDKGETGNSGSDGKGWTGGNYNSSTGKVSFTSTDGLDFDTDDLRGKDGANGDHGTQVFLRSGAPTSISGSRVGDICIDVSSGDLYELEA